MHTRHAQAGSVIVITLWTITLLAILVTVIASQVRLSAKAAMLHQDDLSQWAALSSAMSRAEMELVLAVMPPGVEEQELSELGRRPEYRYNGESLTLHYPQDENVVVRIYDHAGKINLREIGTARLRDLLAKRLGEDEATQERLGELIAAWTDWTDLSDGTSPGGAEADYYLELDPPYRPRNGPIETVEEIMRIKGFDEVFAGVDLDAAFTVYGDDELINFNLATVEAMQLLPGLDDDMIQDIVAYRREDDIRGNGDLAQLVPAETMALLRSWSNNRGFSYFRTIMVYPRSEELQETDDGTVLVDTATYALGEVVQVDSPTARPRIYKVNPYQRIPIRLPPTVED